MRLIALFGIAALASCASNSEPPIWQGISFPSAGFESVEGTSNEHGIYLVYHDLEYQDLFTELEQSLGQAGYSKVGEAFDGAVVGFVKERSEIAMKVDQFGSTFYVALFDEKGKEPILHKLVFGRAELGPKLTDEEAKAQILKDFAE